MTIPRILKFVHHETGINLEQYSAIRSRRRAAAKTLYAVVGRHFGHSYPALGEAIGASHTSIIAAERRSGVPQDMIRRFRAWTPPIAGYMALCNGEPMGYTEDAGCIMIRSWATLFPTEDDARGALASMGRYLDSIGSKAHHDKTFRIIALAEPGVDPAHQKEVHE